jgi:nucleoside-diphosphate-sugar epimerase
MTVLVTGGAGFIGSNFARLVRARERIVVNLTAHDAGNPENWTPCTNSSTGMWQPRVVRG